MQNMQNDLEHPHAGRQQEFSTPLDASLLDSLNSIVNFLHSEGFYAAEESLLREIEERYSLEASDEKAQPCADSVLPGTVTQPQGGIEFHPNVPGSVHEVQGLESAEK